MAQFCQRTGNGSLCCVLAPQSNNFSENIYNEWGAGGVAFLTIPTLLTVVMLAIYAEEIYYIFKKGDSKDLVNSLSWLLGTPPAVMVIGTVAIFIPRAVVYLSFIYGIFVAFAVYKYYYLIMIFVGGTKSFVDKSGGKTVALNQLPCCCLVCLPRIYNSTRTTEIAKWLILQNVIFTPLYGALGVLLKADGKLYSNQSLSAALFLSILNAIATLLCMYGFKLISELSKHVEGLEKVHAIKGKTRIIQLIMFITGFEGIIFNILAQCGVFPCKFPLNFQSRRKVIFNYAVVLQMFFIGLLARHYFRRRTDIQRQATLTDEVILRPGEQNAVYTAVDAYQQAQQQHAHTYNGTGSTSQVLAEVADTKTEHHQDSTSSTSA